MSAGIGERSDKLEAFGRGEADDAVALGFEAQAGPALLLGRDASCSMRRRAGKPRLPGSPVHHGCRKALEQRRVRLTVQAAGSGGPISTAEGVVLGSGITVTDPNPSPGPGLPPRVHHAHARCAESWRGRCRARQAACAAPTARPAVRGRPLWARQCRYQGNCAAGRTSCRRCRRQPRLTAPLLISRSRAAARADDRGDVNLTSQ
jgi:hypothetical protein